MTVFPTFNTSFKNMKYRPDVNLTYMEVIQIIFNKLYIAYAINNTHIVS